MRRALASFVNDLGIRIEKPGTTKSALHFYRLAARLDRTYSAPWYNLGVIAKYAHSWPESRSFNQRAVSLRPDDEDAWWNLGIAATALRDWAEARRAWTRLGVELLPGDGEVRMEPMSACVRLNPEDSGEVVWGNRIDPARLQIMNVPLPESGHRYRDIVLNDGAQNGTRVDQNGTEVPVFDELEIFEPSRYSTYRANLSIPDASAEEELARVCETAGVGLEDWSTIRILCEQCSKGSPGPHTCDAGGSQAQRRFAFAAESEEVVHAALKRWSAASGGAILSDVDIALQA